MKEKKRKVITSQQKIILDYLKETKLHPSAKMVYKEVKKKLPKISLSTVYRILNDLKEREEIQEIPVKIVRFDGETSQHAHFICLKCQKIFDILKDFKILKTKKLKFGRVKNYQIYFYGYCKNCQLK